MQLFSIIPETKQKTAHFCQCDEKQRSCNNEKLIILSQNNDLVFKNDAIFISHKLNHYSEIVSHYFELLNHYFEKVSHNFEIVGPTHYID